MNFVKKLGTILLLFACPLVARTQTLDTEYHPEDEEFRPASEDEMFVVPTWNLADPFSSFSKYRFGAVRYRARGLDLRHSRVRVGAIDLTNNLLGSPDWSLISLARRSGLALVEAPAMVAGGTSAEFDPESDLEQVAGLGRAFPASLGRSENYALRAAAENEFYAVVRGGNRYSRAGGDVRLSRSLSRGWSLSLAATGQLGDDGRIAGIYTDEVGGSATLGRKWPNGLSLTIFAAGGISERGGRAAVVSETIELTRNKFYNPTWGWQDGKLRNSRLTRNRNLLTIFELSAPIGSQKLTFTAAFRGARRGRTRLAWFGALSPLPDYYRSLPSHYPDWHALRVIEDAWRTADPRVTQIDWDNFYYVNTLSEDGQSTYMLEEQVDTARDVHLDLNFSRRLAGSLTLDYGISARRDFSQFYKLADDLLGGEWVSNTDQYLSDYQDDELHSQTPDENDLRNPGRKVRLGERFGYDYTFTRLQPSVFGVIEWNELRRGLSVSGEIAHSRIQRNGLTEKGLFPGTKSFGRSMTMAFSTWRLALAGWIHLGRRHSLSIAAMAGSELPTVENIFLAPQQNNFTVGDLSVSGFSGGELSWAYSTDNLDIRAAGFINSTTGETLVRSYYDDLAQKFARMVVRGIDRLGYGLEAGIEARPLSWLTLSAGASLGRYRFNNEPVATIFEDATASIFSDGVVCYLSGLHTGPPERVVGVQVDYSNRRYMRASTSAEWMGRRYVEINPLHHSSRVVGINPAPEIMAQFMGQERLPDAMTLGLSLSKGWVVGGGFLRVAAGVRNLLNNSIIHSAYEQMRIRRLGTGLARTLVPFPTKYLYSWPATWNFSISYRL